MKKIIVSVFFFVICSFSLMGQNKPNTLPLTTIYEVVDSTKTEISSRAHVKIKWIESINLVQQSELPPSGIIGEKPIPGIIIIHIKQEYNQEVLKKLKKRIISTEYPNIN